MIRTVLGDIEPKELGYTLCHEHFIIDLDRVRKDGVSKIETIEEVEPEIKLAMEQGIKSAIEVSTIDLGRDIKKLVQISKDTKLNIIASTGFYLSEYHPDYLKDLSTEEVSTIYIKELTEGIDGTGVKAGIIAEIASNKNEFIGEEEKILRAAALASNKTGAAVSTHTNRPNGIKTVEILLSEGINPDKVIIGHQDLIDDVDYHESILKYGVNIGFDTCGKSAYMPDETRARNIIELVNRGYGDHILLSNDVSRRTYFTSFKGPGYTAVMGNVVPLLREYGLSQDNIDKLLYYNPARILDNEWE